MTDGRPKEQKPAARQTDVRATSSREKAGAMGTSMNAPTNTSTTPTSSITAPSVFKVPSYGGTTHGALPVMEVDEQLELLSRLLGQQKLDGYGGGYVELIAEKLEGTEHQEEVCIDAVALFLSFLHTVDLTASPLCQYEGVKMPPITSTDRTKGFPNTPTTFFLYVEMERKWTLNQFNHEPDKNGKLWPNVNKMVLHISCLHINLHNFLEIAHLDLKRIQMEARWKMTQLKSSSPKMSLLGVPDGLDLAGVTMTLTHVLKQAKDYLIKHGILDFQTIDEELPDFAMYFKRMKEGRVPPAVYRTIAWANVKGFNTDGGLRMLNFECKDKDWILLAKLLAQLDASELRKLFRMALCQEQLKRKPLTDDVIKHNRNVANHIKYSLNVGYTSHLGITDMEKLVEMRFEDGRISAPKFSCLRRLYSMNLTNPITGKALVQSVYPVPEDHGRVQVMYVQKHGNGEYLNRIAENPTGFW